MSQIDLIRKATQLIRHAKDRTKLQRYLPYGHPSTLCPDGEMWQALNKSGHWHVWSNKPWQLEFHAMGATRQERMLMAANRVGKTVASVVECCYHATGLYPDWWIGKRFNHGVLIWTGSPTNETSRDIMQAQLLGGLGEQLGTGFIPASKLLGNPSMRQCGVKGVVDSFMVRHVSGGVSTIMLKSYEQGWRKWQGTAPHVVAMDEEPEDYRIFTECETRVLTSKGILMISFMPLSGMTELVQHFQAGKPGTFLGSASWEDVPHLGEVEKRELAERYPDYERDARTRGIPMLGEGAVFHVKESDITIDPFAIPDHWARIKGCDFGMRHPAAGVEIAWDRDTDVIYVIDSYRASDKTPAYHAAWFNKTNRMIPVAWPHDGVNREKSGGGTLAEAYRSHGVNMLTKSARYRASAGQSEKAGSQPMEPIISEILERMLTGRFKVFSSQHLWFEEYRYYHRKDGRIVPLRDDILTATFYAVMMKRYAVPLTRPQRHVSASSPIVTSRIQ